MGIYHLLSLRLGQHVAVAQVVDLDILDVIAVGHVHFPMNSRSVVAASRWPRREDVFGWLGRAWLFDGRDLHRLDSPARLELRIDFRGGGGYVGS